MLVSVSGMVGTGKTTAARQLERLLLDAGHEVSVLRFQSLPCFALLRSPSGRRDVPTSHQAGSGGATKRWSGYRRKRLTLSATAVYLARILAFRLYARRLPRSRTYILNRYFYDLFAHYHLSSSAERRRLRLLRAAMPVPDLAILMVADVATVAERRPTYSGEYLAQVADTYSRLPGRFAELIEVRSDAPESTADTLRRLMAPALSGTRSVPVR